MAKKYLDTSINQNVSPPSISFNTGRRSPLASLEFGKSEEKSEPSPKKTPNEKAKKTSEEKIPNKTPNVSPKKTIEHKPTTWETAKKIFGKAKNFYNSFQSNNPDAVDAISGALAALGQGYSSEGGPGDILGKFVMGHIEKEQQSEAALAYDSYIDARLSNRKPTEQTIKDLSKSPELMLQANQYVDKMERRLTNNATFNTLYDELEKASQFGVDKIEEVDLSGAVNLDSDLQEDLFKAKSEMINARREQESKIAFTEEYNRLKNFEYSEGGMPEFDTENLAKMSSDDRSSLFSQQEKMEEKDLERRTQEQFNEALFDYVLNGEDINLSEYELVTDTQWNNIKNFKWNPKEIEKLKRKTKKKLMEDGTKLSPTDKLKLDTAYDTIKYARETISQEEFKQTMSAVYDKLEPQEKRLASQNKNILMYSLLFSNMDISPNSNVQALIEAASNLVSLGLSEQEALSIVNTSGLSLSLDSIIGEEEEEENNDEEYEGDLEDDYDPLGSDIPEFLRQQTLDEEGNKLPGSTKDVIDAAIEEDSKTIEEGSEADNSIKALEFYDKQEKKGEKEKEEKEEKEKKKEEKKKQEKKKK